MSDIPEPPDTNSYRREYRRPPLKPGTRVRHYGEQYAAARCNGTAVVLWAFVSNGHLEYRIRRDKPLFEGVSVETDWSDEHTFVVEGGL